METIRILLNKLENNGIDVDAGDNRRVFTEVLEQSYEAGFDVADTNYEEAVSAAYDRGYAEAEEEVWDDAVEEGREQGWDEGYSEGYDDGYADAEADLS